MNLNFLELQSVQEPSSWLEALCLIGVPSLILLAGVIDDLRSRKVHNKLILGLLPVALVSQFLIFGVSGIGVAALSFGLALCLTVPMVLSGMLGGGDMKLLAVFGLATNMNAVLWVAVLSILFGGLLGLVRAMVSGQGLVLVTNTFRLLKREKIDSAKLHPIPYTVALFFGWITFLSLNNWGGLLR